MTREELREHCKKQIRACEMWAHSQGERPLGKVYEEHKLILELLEQEHVLDKIRAEIDFEAIAEMMELNSDEELKHQWKYFYDTLHVFGLKICKENEETN